MKDLFGIALVASAIMLSSCNPDCYDGNGRVTTQTRNVSAFTGVVSNGDFDVNIYPGEEYGVIVEADENLMGLIITRVSGGELIIETRHGDCLRSSENIRITVSLPDLNHIDLNGSGNVWCDTLSTQDLEVDLDGSGTIRCNSLIVPNMDFDMSGSGKIEADGTFTKVRTVIDGSGEVMLSGASQIADFYISGSGIITAGELFTGTCHADITGSGTIYAWVKDLLEVNISGSGIVYYYGDSPVVNTHITGSGQVIKKN
jgi:Putative auto-transporter adhesin, head GIN domain